MRNAFYLPELTPEQQKMLIEIRRRKTELLLEIQVRELSCTFYVVLDCCFLVFERIFQCRLNRYCFHVHILVSFSLPHLKNINPKTQSYTILILSLDGCRMPTSFIINLTVTVHCDSLLKLPVFQYQAFQYIRFMCFCRRWKFGMW
jgi:hypothetical protein